MVEGTGPQYHRRFEELKRYVGFVTDADGARLGQLRAHAEPHFGDIASEFYRRAREDPEAHAVFRDEAQIARLQGTLVVWMNRLLTGPYDQDYCDQSARIGAVHVQVGLPQRFMAAAMTLIRERLARVAQESMGAEAWDVVTALNRILDVELALMAETYADAHAQRLERSRLEQLRSDRLGNYVAAVELTPTVVVGLDFGGHVRLINREAERVLGRSIDILE
ncbi:MAG: histidine kinase, partial [Myxococcales bacterium]|nr:histidine kinase [Myxococcales bacterium]